MYMPIHQDDINTQTAALLDAASVPATIVNWAGDEPVSVQEYCAYIGELAGFEPVVHVVEQPGTLRGSVTDNTAASVVHRALPRDLARGSETGLRRPHRIADMTWDGADQRVLLTGASSGIGAAAAVEFARAGAVVCLVARRADRLAEVLAEVQIHSPASQVLVADLSDLDGIDAVAARATELLGGRVDVLVNNAGVPKRRSVVTMTPDDVEGVMAMNYFSPVRLTLAVLPAMVTRGTGHVVNVSSMGVHMAAFKVGAYSASKAALEMFTESLHVELAHTDIRAHLFVPGHDHDGVLDAEGGQRPALPRRPCHRRHRRRGRRRPGRGARRRSPDHLRHRSRRVHRDGRRTPTRTPSSPSSARCSGR